MHHAPPTKLALFTPHLQQRWRWLLAVLLAGAAFDSACTKQRTTEPLPSIPAADASAVTPANVIVRPSVAVVPFLGANGQPDWMGMTLADHLTTRLLVHSRLDAKILERVVPLNVFGWRQTLAAARAEGVALTDLVRRSAAVSEQLGADALLVGTYAVAGDKVTLRWQLLGGRGTAHEISSESKDLTRASNEIATAVFAELTPGFVATGGQSALVPLPSAVAKDFGSALEIVAQQSLDPRAQVVLERADLERAQKLLTSVTTAVPGFVRAWTERGNVATLLQDYKGAETALQRALAERDDPEPSTALAIFSMYLRQGQHLIAQKALEDAVETYPGSLQTLGYLGEAYVREHRPEDALRTFTRYAAMVPKSPWAQMRRGAALSRLGQHETALREGQALAAKYPDSVAVLVALASRQIDAGKIDEARTTLARGLTKSPNHPALLTRLAYIELGANHAAEALALAEKAVAAIGDGRGEPLAGYAHVDMAQALALLGRTDDAFVALNKAVELGVGADDLDRLGRDERLKAFLADPRCPALVRTQLAH